MSSYDVPPGFPGLREVVEAYCEKMGVSIRAIEETIDIRPGRLQGFVDYRHDLTTEEVDKFLALDGRLVNG